VTLVIDANYEGKTPTTTDEYFQNFCTEVADRHCFIRSAAIANNAGNLMAAVSRKDLVAFLTQEESEHREYQYHQSLLLLMN
jgi:hypothetical protein